METRSVAPLAEVVRLQTKGTHRSTFTRDSFSGGVACFCPSLFPDERLGGLALPVVRAPLGLLAFSCAGTVLGSFSIVALAGVPPHNASDKGQMNGKPIPSNTI